MRVQGGEVSLSDLGASCKVRPGGKRTKGKSATCMSNRRIQI